MSKSIYVGNLNYKVTSDDLKSIFEEYGQVSSAKVVQDYDGRSKGFGFVDMVADDDAQKAVAELDGAECEGRTMRVNFARPRNNTRSY